MLTAARAKCRRRAWARNDSSCVTVMGVYRSLSKFNDLIIICAAGPPLRVPELQLGRRHHIHLVDHLGKHFDLAVQPLRAELLDAPSRQEKEIEAEYGAWKLLLEQLKEADAAQASNLGQALGLQSRDDSRT
jgi:hypothetical protein